MVYIAIGKDPRQFQADARYCTTHGYDGASVVPSRGKERASFLRPAASMRYPAKTGNQHGDDNPDVDECSRHISPKLARCAAAPRIGARDRQTGRGTTQCVSEPGTGTWFALPPYHQSSWLAIEAISCIFFFASPPARRHGMLAASLTVVNGVAGCDSKGVWFI
jgi:hypothetical protein